MSRVTTIITGPDGSVTKIVTRRSGCGCVTILAAIVVLFGPAAWFGAWAVPAYIFLGVIAVLGCLGWFVQKTGRTPKPTNPQPPPVAAPPP
jgi:cytochrome bd-type quinol oxidase subunit 1